LLEEMGGKLGPHHGGSERTEMADTLLFPSQQTFVGGDLRALVGEDLARTIDYQLPKAETDDRLSDGYR
jgi:hypothetical protein